MSRRMSTVFSLGAAIAKIVDLAFEDYAVAIDCSRVKAWFMNGRGKVKILEDGIGMFFPKTRRFRVALHSRQGRYNMAGWNRGATFVIYPPVIEGLIWSDVETLLRQGSFGKRVRHICAKNKEVFASRDSIEKTGASLVDTIGICLVKYFNRSHARPCGPIADTACFLAAVQSLNAICPYKKEDGVILINSNWVV
jgi:hypothetical protein